MHHHHQGWALFEIVIAMALMGVAVAGTVLLQGQALLISQRALIDAQALGLAVELFESAIIGLDANTTEAHVNERLRYHAPNLTLSLVTTQQSQSVQLVNIDAQHASADVRWQLSIER